jgi:hypothetical protein
VTIDEYLVFVAARLKAEREKENRVEVLRLLGVVRDTVNDVIKQLEEEQIP